MKKWLLRLRLKDEMLIDTCEARDQNHAFIKFIYRNFTMLANVNQTRIIKHISLITEGEDAL